MESLRGRWRRRKYVRLDGGAVQKRRSSHVGQSQRRRRRFWQIRISPRLNVLRICSPKRFLVRLRDAYVRLMLRLASSGSLTGGFGYAVDLPGAAGFGKPALKEYDEKAIVEIYKTLVAQGQLILRQSQADKPPEIAAQR